MILVEDGVTVIKAVDLAGRPVPIGTPVIVGPRGPRGLAGDGSGSVDIGELTEEVAEALEPPVDLTQLFLNALV